MSVVVLPVVRQPRGEREYLGDGVYASWDGYHIWLSLDAQPSGDEIGMEPHVVEQLEKYVAHIRRLEKELRS